MSIFYKFTVPDPHLIGFYNFTKLTYNVVSDANMEQTLISYNGVLVYDTAPRNTVKYNYSGINFDTEEDLLFFKSTFNSPKINK